MEDFFKPLENLQKVDVPDDLLEKTERRIYRDRLNTVSTTTLWGVAASFLILVSVNVVAINKQKKNINELSVVSNSFKILSDNNLY